MCCVVIVKRVFLISFFNVPSLGIFGIYGGSCGTNLVDMSLLWLRFLLDGERPLPASFLQVAWTLGPSFILWCI